MMKVDEAHIKNLMKTLNLTREEALEVIEYDQAVNHGEKTKYDLSPEQTAFVQDMTRHRDHKKHGPTVHKRKPNDVKIGIMAMLQDYFANEFELDVNDEVLYCSNVELTNPSRMLHFSIGNKEFDLQLIEKRGPHKKD